MKTEKYKNTPFTIVEDETKNETFIVVGNNAVFKCKTKQDAVTAIESKDWELICNLMYVIKNFKGHETKTNENT